MPNWALAGGLARLAGGLAVEKGSALARAAYANPYGKAALMGAGIGAAYGAYSNNSSAWEGAKTGAMYGLGARYGMNKLSSGLNAYQALRQGGVGIRNAFAGARNYTAWEMGQDVKATASYLWNQGARSAAYLGNTAKRAYGRIRGMY